MNDKNYDTWKLSTPEYYDLNICEHCELDVGEYNLEEVNYKDADRNTRTLFLCKHCIEKEIWV